MIILTGGAGFIGSAMIWRLNEAGIDDILIVDQVGAGMKWKNLVKRRFSDVIGINDLKAFLAARPNVDAVFHMGACSSTTEKDMDFLLANNVHYSMEIFNFCTAQRVPLIYASSAATYGAKEEDFADGLDAIHDLRPINPYGYSKQLFDLWVSRQKQTPPFWAGIKFFNVYGPQEYHKEGQASVVFHAFPQVRDNSSLRLFKSYRPDIAHGDQRRDFVYIKDVVEVMFHMYSNRQNAVSGLYNLGTGEARTFADLGRAVFSALDKTAKFEWVEMPDSIRNQYQYYTEADLTRLRRDIGYTKPFVTLEAGVRDYVQNYLNQEDPYL